MIEPGDLAPSPAETPYEHGQRMAQRLEEHAAALGRIKIRFRKPGSYGFVRDVEMLAVPRQDEEIAMKVSDIEGLEVKHYTVHVVDWMVDEPDFDVYVVLR